MAFARKVATIPPGRKGKEELIVHFVCSEKMGEKKTLADWTYWPKFRASLAECSGKPETWKDVKKKRWKRLKRSRESWPDKHGERECFRLWGEGKKRKSQKGRKGAMDSLRKDHKHSIKARSSCFSYTSMKMLNEKIGRATLLHHG